MNCCMVLHDVADHWIIFEQIILFYRTKPPKTSEQWEKKQIFSFSELAMRNLERNKYATIYFIISAQFSSNSNNRFANVNQWNIVRTEWLTPWAALIQNPKKCISSNSAIFNPVSLHPYFTKFFHSAFYFHVSQQAAKKVWSVRGMTSKIKT